MKRFLCVLICVIMLFSVIPANAASGDEVRILFSHDLHSYVNPFSTQIDGEDLIVGGFARRAQLINEYKNAHENTFVFDAGDFSMGTLLQSVYKERAAELTLLDAMGYDATTLGNHEFDFRDSGLAEMLVAAKKNGCDIPLLVGNMTSNDAEVNAALQNYGVQEYIVIDRAGVKVAVFGLMGQESYDYAPMTEFEFEPIESAAKRIVEKIKTNETVDMIVCLSHSGTSENEKESEDELLAKAVPEIDVIISGHSHTLLAEPITIENTHILSGGEYGMYFASAVFTKKADGRWDINEYSVDPLLPGAEDEAIKSMADGFMNDVQELYLSEYGYDLTSKIAKSNYSFTPVSLFGDVLEEDTLGNLISDSYMWAIKEAEGENYVPVTMTLTACGIVRGSINKGDITVVDAYNISSLGVGADGKSGYPLIYAYITGKELKTACEVDCSVSQIMSEAQLYMSGVAYTYNPNRLILNRVTDAWIVGENGERIEIEDDKLYRIACGLYCAQMLSTVEEKSFGLLEITAKDANGTPIEDFEKYIIHYQNGNELKEWSALADYLKHMGSINEKYSAAEGRKVAVDDKSISALLSSPNKVGKLVLGVSALLAFIVILTIILIVRKIKRKKNI